MSLAQISKDEYIVSGPDRHAYHFSTNKLDDGTGGLYSIWPTALQEVQPVVVPGTELKVIPYGYNNKLPQIVRDAVRSAHLPGGIFKKMLFLNWGEGPKLYTEKVVNGEPYREFVQDDEVQAWLESWGFEKYLMALMVDYNQGEGCYTKMVCNRGIMIGRPGKILQLEHLSWGDCRLEWPDDFRTPKAVIEANWELPFMAPIKRYPMFDRKAPFANAVAAHFAYLPSFMNHFYSIPSYAGSLDWMQNSATLPRAIKALMRNAAVVKFHVKVPEEYWNKVEQKLRERCQFEGKTYSDALFIAEKARIMTELTTVLSGVDNVGKFFSSTTFKDRVGEATGWEIVPIDQKVKDYIEGMKEVNTMADRATIGGIGLHQALANVSADGKSDSGSEQLYALKLYKNSQVAIPEMIVCEAINMAIKANWPTKKLKLGFYHAQVQREQDVTSKDRITENA